MSKNVGRPKIYKINEDYFEKIDNGNKAYIIGFIFADGSVNGKSLAITIHKRDIEILHFIKKELESEHPIKTYRSDFVTFSISNKKICDDLYKQNIIPNKTYLTKNLPYDGIYFKDFLRGLFDGDGCITTSLKKINDYCISISNNYHLLNELKNFLKNELNINSYLRLRRKGNYNTGMLEFKGSLQIERFYNFIYSNGDFHLKRKEVKFIISLKNAEKHKKTDYQNNGVWGKIKELYLTNVTQKEISKILSIPYSSVRTCVQKMRIKNMII